VRYGSGEEAYAVLEMGRDCGGAVESSRLRWGWRVAGHYVYVLLDMEHEMTRSIVCGWMICRGQKAPQVQVSS